MGNQLDSSEADLTLCFTMEFSNHLTCTFVSWQPLFYDLGGLQWAQNDHDSFRMCHRAAQKVRVEHENRFAVLKEIKKQQKKKNSTRQGKQNWDNVQPLEANWNKNFSTCSNFYTCLTTQKPHYTHVFTRKEQEHPETLHIWIWIMNWRGNKSQLFLKFVIWLEITRWVTLQSSVYCNTAWLLIKLIIKRS